MAHNFVQTSIQTEGSSELKDFLLKYDNKLKNVDEIYTKLSSNGVEYSDVMEFTETDFREVMKDINMKKIQISRLFNVLKYCKESQICKEQNIVKPKVIREVIRVILSREEEQCFSNIDQKQKQIMDIIKNIKIKLNNCDENNKKNQEIINENFDIIFKVLNQRKNKLLSNL
eukprot:117193_1